MSALLYEWAPLRVFLVWHPEYEAGSSVFTKLYSWLGGPGRALEQLLKRVSQHRLGRSFGRVGAFVRESIASCSAW